MRKIRFTEHQDHRRGTTGSHRHTRCDPVAFGKTYDEDSQVFHQYLLALYPHLLAGYSGGKLGLRGEDPGASPGLLLIIIFKIEEYLRCFQVNNNLTFIPSWLPISKIIFYIKIS